MTGALTGGLFGRTKTGAVVGAVGALRDWWGDLKHHIQALGALNQASLDRIDLLDRMLQGFLLALESNAEKLFDWAGTKTFGSAVNLEELKQAYIAGKSVSLHPNYSEAR